MLRVEIRSKTHDSSRGAVRQILRDVAFTAEPGEVLALVGSSGIGKSTILRIVLGLDRQFEGKVSLPTGRLGVMFQEPRLLPWLSVEDNLLLVHPERGEPIDIGGLLQEVMLPPVEQMLPSELSLGMARRVALARAFAVDPEILVLDEPFASLDTNLGAALGARIIDRVRRRGMLVLLSTHDVDQVLAMASRMLVVAGHPATLAADVAVPSDTAGRLAMREELLARFSFMGRSPDPSMPA